MAAKPLGDELFWQAGAPQSVAVLAVRPDGQKVAGVRVQGTIVRREWHQRASRARRRARSSSATGSPTRSPLHRHDAADARCRATFTPNAGGIYTVTFTATDRNGRAATHELPALGVRNGLGAVERRVAVQDGRHPRSDALLGRRHGDGAVRVAVHKRGSVDHRRARRDHRAAAASADVRLDDTQVSDHRGVRT